jgi:hypothetical protein
MAWQLIYTSAPRTLSAGQSGYGTVARSVDLREALGQRLEQLSYYSHPTGGTKPVICACRLIDLRGAKYHVLTRILDAGLDFTSRTNHLAHHLIFTPEELVALPSPAIFFQHWDGWRSEWREEPRLLDGSDWGNLSALPTKTLLPAARWQENTGDAGRAAALVERPYAEGCHLVVEPGNSPLLLGLFAESLELLDPGGRSSAKRWQVPFTTLLQDQDNPADFRWRGCESDSAPWLAARRVPGALIAAPGELAVPVGLLSHLARKGLPSPPATSAAKTGAASPKSKSEGPKPSTEKPAKPTPIRGMDPGLFEKPKTQESQRSAAPGSFSPRIVAPTAGAVILLLLLGGFVWPGWFLRPKDFPVPPPETPTAVPTTPTLETVLPDVPPASMPKNDPPEPAAPTASPEVLARLEREFDSLRSYLVMAALDDTFALPRILELELLLQRIFKDNPVLPSEAIEALAENDRISLTATDAARRLRLDIDPFGAKSILFSSAAGSVLKLDCTAWYKDAAQPVRVQVLEPRLKSLALTLRPAKGGENFSPFRLVLAGDRSEPVRLDKSLLRANRTSLADSLDPALNQKLGALLPLESGHLLQLRPFTGSPPRDLYDDLQLHNPPPGWELHFHQLRIEINRSLARWTNDLPALEKKLRASEREVTEANEHDLHLGDILGLKAKDPLASFRSYAVANKRSATDPATYVAYLRDLLEKGLPKDQLERLLKPASPEELKNIKPALATAGFEAGALARIPDDYFQRRWEPFERRAKLLDERRIALLRIADFRNRLAKVPEDLAATPQVSLFLVSPNGRRLELVRFTDAPTKTAP